MVGWKDFIFNLFLFLFIFCKLEEIGGGGDPLFQGDAHQNIIDLLFHFIQWGHSSIVSYCDRSTKQLFCICLVVCCFKVLVFIVVIARLAN